jgi:hypothetical protein
MNSPKDFNEFLRNTLLEKFEEFLDYVWVVIWEKLPDATRMKNISNFSLNLKLVWDVNFQEELAKKFEIVKVAKKWFIEDAIKERKKQIKSAEFYLIPRFHIETLEYDVLYIIRKKDKLDNVKQQVKDFLDNLLPKPEPEFTYRLL